MSNQSNVFSQGGGGTLFEFETHAAFFTTMLIGGHFPGNEGQKIVQYRQQSSSLGYSTDDLLLQTADHAGGNYRLLVQIKHGLIISKADKTWEEVLSKAWKDFTNPELFDKVKDRILIIKSDLSQNEKRHLKILLDWAKSKTDEADFTNEVSRIKGKQYYYDIFVEILQRLGISPTQTELYDFFRCFDIWEYDFGNVSSVNRSNFINLIELSKRPGTRLHAAEIWDKIVQFVAGTDSKGGMIEWEKIPASLAEFFNPDYYPLIQRQLAKLTEQSREMIDFIDNHIGNVSIDRSQLVAVAREELENNRIVVIAGDPGSGKSAIAKNLLSQTGGNLIALRADELTEGNLMDVLKRKGIDLTIAEFFNHFPLYNQNTIYIDALEKLLEGEGKPFRELLKSLAKHPDIKIVTTCRNVSFRLLEIKYFSEQSFFKQDIGFLSDTELTEVVGKLPMLKSLAENRRLSGLIKVPKYLDFAFRAITSSGKSFSEIGEAEFIRELWDIIVENSINEARSGLPQKRNEAFIQIAVSRAKQMAPFVVAGPSDPEALEKLAKENVLIRSREGLYAPGHDVLEDWALIRYVDKCYREKSDGVGFFKALGTEPAMRRAYRLWVQQALNERDEEKITFFSSNLGNSTVERFWQDESLIALLYSDYTETFLENNEVVLELSNWSLFFRIVHILRTACRENSRNTWAERHYVPIGPGWSMVIKFIAGHIEQFPDNRYDLILTTLQDYSKLLYLDSRQVPVLEEAGLISLVLLEKYKAKAEYLDEDKKVQQCLKLIFDFGAGIKKELDELFAIVFLMEDKDDRSGNWEETRYYHQITSLALDGLTTGQLPRQYPDLLVQLAKKRWYYSRKAVSNTKNSFETMMSQIADDGPDQQFGLSLDRESYVAPSAYKTFVYSLLRYHPNLGIDFIIEFINQVTVTFIKQSEFKDHPGTKMEIVMPDGNKKIVRGIPDFWVAYRGNVGGVPHLISSVLMALERYLIELGNTGEAAEELFRLHLEKLYTQGDSLLITGLLASVCRAHPTLAGEWVLPLFSNKQFFDWDLSSSTRNMTLGFGWVPDNDYEKERDEADHWKHRTKYLAGLRTFIADPILYWDGLGPRIFAIIDKYRREVEKEDLDWRRVLDDIDVRTWKAKESVKQPDGKILTLFQPEYEPDVAAKYHQDIAERPFDVQNSTDSLWMNKVLDGEEKMDLGRWRTVYQRYRELTTFVWHEHAPGLAAAIATRDSWDHLTIEEKTWSAETIVSIIRGLQKDEFRETRISSFDRKAVYVAFPLLLWKTDTGLDNKIIRRLFFDLLVDHHFDDLNHKYLLISFGEHAWQTSSKQASSWWRGMIHFATLRLQAPAGFQPDKHSMDVYYQKLENLFNAIQDEQVDLKVPDIAENSYNSYFLAKAIVMLPDKGIQEDGINFLIQMIQLYQLHEETKDRFRRGSRDQGIEVEVKNTILQKVAPVLLYNPNEQGRRLFDNLLDRITANDFLKKVINSQTNLFSFFRSTLERVITVVDKASRKEEAVKTVAYMNFKDLWEYFDRYLTGKNTAVFSDLLLMNTSWKEGLRRWEPIEEMVLFLGRMIEKYGLLNIGPVINLLTYPANELLMPKGVTVLADLIRAWPLKPLLSYPFSEKLLYRAYEFNLEEIKSDKIILANYLFLLDELIIQGSSDAYWIREFLISFRTQPSKKGKDETAERSK